ncbi:hypothetical protein ACFVXH_01760 [Kitasatospora sp. NPDC058184]|uniref:hypothetical protein n=1 Tax=Kitasatospora sp. NPDC058184 TaxID=3346370 RepID=UPI0036DE1145
MDNATTGHTAEARSLADTETNGTAEEGRVTRTERRPGLTVRTFSVAQDGTRYDDSGVTSAYPGPDEYVARIEVWPACACPQHRAG